MCGKRAKVEEKLQAKRMKTDKSFMRTVSSTLTVPNDQDFKERMKTVAVNIVKAHRADVRANINYAIFQISHVDADTKKLVHPSSQGPDDDGFLSII
jgi:hypothetical protein